jgi:hypothetical protein
MLICQASLGGPGKLVKIIEKEIPANRPKPDALFYYALKA